MMSERKRRTDPKEIGFNRLHGRSMGGLQDPLLRDGGMGLPFTIQNPEGGGIFGPYGESTAARRLKQ